MGCLVCNGPISGRAKTCSDKCRKALSRNVTKTVTNDKCDKPSVTQPGRCYKCGAELAYAKQTCCGPCAWGRQGYAHEGRRPAFQSQGAVLTGGYRLTDYEAEHYRPEDQLKKGEHNPVSKPGYPEGKTEAEISPQARGVGGDSVSEE